MTQIRPATIDDADALAALERKAFDFSLYHLMSKAQFSHLIRKGNAEIFVAEEGGAISGMGVLLFKSNSGFGRFYSLAVDPDLQKGTIGKDIFQHMERRITEKGLKGMLLEVRADNQRLLERYKALGYAVTYEVADYYPDGVSCIKMKKVF